jgi:hypothetical protein
MNVGKMFALELCPGYISKVHLRNGKQNFEIL